MIYFKRRNFKRAYTKDFCCWLHNSSLRHSLHQWTFGVQNQSKSPFFDQSSRCKIKSFSVLKNDFLSIQKIPSLVLQAVMYLKICFHLSWRLFKKLQRDYYFIWWVKLSSFLNNGHKKWLENVYLEKFFASMTTSSSARFVNSFKLWEVKRLVFCCCTIYDHCRIKEIGLNIAKYFVYF